MRPIAILTDFGIRDWYVASMKGVLLKIAPTACVVDISHHVPMGDIGRAAFILEQCYHEFPEGTVFLVVVDPGVGTTRKPIAIEHEGYTFVGPDNGLFSFLWRDDTAVPTMREITNPYFTKELPGHTFHGRDIFAPVAAHLAAGEPFERVGAEFSQPTALPFSAPEFKKNKVKSTVSFIDHYGNLITNIREETWGKHYPDALSIAYKKTAIPLSRTYGEVPPGTLTAYFGSGGFLEIAINSGNAAEHLSLLPGSDIKLKIVRKSEEK